MKKILYLSIALFIFMVIPTNIKAQNKVNLYFFWGEGCPYCEHQKPFLEEMEKKYSQLTIYDYETWNNAENQKILLDVGKLLNKKIGGVPFTVIGDKTFVGFNKTTSPKEIENTIIYYINNSYTDIVGEMLGIVESTSPQTDVNEKDITSEKIGETKDTNVEKLQKEEMSITSRQKLATTILAFSILVLIVILITLKKKKQIVQRLL